MKLILAGLAAVIVFFSACDRKKENNDTSKYTASSARTDSATAAVILFDHDTHDFGVIKQGEKVTYNFAFRNAGKSPLIIIEAHSSCGCTIPEPPKEPIKPGGRSILKVVFNSAGKAGKIEKAITVTSNALNNYANVYLTGEVSVPTTK